jgi:hypothetical protein
MVFHWKGGWPAANREHVLPTGEMHLVFRGRVRLGSERDAARQLDVLESALVRFAELFRQSVGLCTKPYCRVRQFQRALAGDTGGVCADRAGGTHFTGSPFREKGD